MSDPSGAVTTDTSAAPSPAPAETPAANPAPAEQQTPTESAAPSSETFDWDKIRENPEIANRIKEEVSREADRLAQSRLSRQARQSAMQRAQQAVADDDADSALELARQIPGLLADPEDGASIPVAQKQQVLADLINSEEYRAAYLADKAGLDKIFETGTPAEITSWVNNHASERKKAEDARVLTLAKALAEQTVNERLGGTPVQLTGGSPGQMSDAQFLSAYGRGESDDHERASKLLGKR